MDLSPSRPLSSSGCWEIRLPEPALAKFWASRPATLKVGSEPLTLPNVVKSNSDFQAVGWKLAPPGNTIEINLNQGWFVEHAVTPEYRVELDVYNGPLDLLLYLIKRDELDIYDIPIARITQTYMDYVHMLRGLKDSDGLDINVAGDFLVMAATLMEIKSAMLLPRAPMSEKGESSAAAELADPRRELVQQLLEYKRIKDSAVALERQHQLHESRFPRYPAEREGDPNEHPPVDLEEVQMWDLLAAFDRLMREVGVRKPRYHEVTYDDTPIDLHAADIEDRLKRDGNVTLKQLMVGRKSRSEMVGVFLALLELIREKKILVDQDAVTDDIQIIPAPEEHRKTYEHASLHLANIETPAAAPKEGMT
jgi:segregation and condensation protein A